MIELFVPSPRAEGAVATASCESVCDSPADPPEDFHPTLPSSPQPPHPPGPCASDPSPSWSAESVENPESGLSLALHVMEDQAPAFSSGADSVGLHAPGSPLESVLLLAGALARREAPVLLHGESGTGKEVLARWLHARSPRREGPFVAVNCAAVSPSLAESELFGHRRGAFTSAHADRPGHIRQAQGGTLFLDEIGDMPLELQPRFLRVLQEKTVRPVGGDEEMPVDFRLVCATHRNLAAEVRAGRFREDLYYRLRVLELRLPPLRERPMDIPWLLRGFLSETLEPARVEAALGRLPLAIMRHHFPGNIRELRNLAERYAALAAVGGDWEQAFAGSIAPLDVVMEAVPAYSKFLRTSRLTGFDVLATLEACGYHRGRAAAKLGVTRRTLQYHLARMRAKGFGIIPKP